MVEAEPGRPLVVSYGGGVNSVAMLVGMRERGIVPDAIVFSDTRGEKPETYEHIEKIRTWIERETEFPSMLILCRADFPKWPLAQEALERGHVVTRAIGFDADEGRRVSKVADPGMAKWYPLIEWDWDRDACVAAIERAGLPIPPKSACFYCPSSTKTEIVQLRKKHPELADRALGIERRALATGRWNVKGLGRRFAWEEVMAASDAELSLFPEAPVESCTICHDGEDAA